MSDSRSWTIRCLGRIGFQERRAEVLAGNAGGLEVVERMADLDPRWGPG